MVKRAFAVVAHPDDIEFMMAGTLLLLRDGGYEIHYMTVANGNCGSVVMDAATTARVRREEAMAACALAGAVYHEAICDDLEIFYERDSLRRMAAVMREVAPEIVLTHPLQDYMEDHMNTARLVLTAAFARGMPNYPVEPPRAPVEQPVTVYHALPYGLRDGLGRPARAAMYVDVGSVLGEKRAMLAEHRSQKEWLDASQGIDSYLQHMEEMSAAMGQISGRFAYAEGWTRHLPLGFCAEDADPLADALKDKILYADQRG
jgi:LmbE family N-acetylglucosaminyl deacetylase